MTRFEMPVHQLVSRHYIGDTFETVVIDTNDIIDSYRDALAQYEYVTGDEPKVLLLGRDQYRAFEKFLYTVNVTHVGQLFSGVRDIAQILGVSIVCKPFMNGFLILSDKDLEEINK